DTARFFALRGESGAGAAAYDRFVALDHAAEALDDVLTSDTGHELSSQRRAHRPRGDLVELIDQRLRELGNVDVVGQLDESARGRGAEPRLDAAEQRLIGGRIPECFAGG